MNAGYAGAICRVRFLGTRRSDWCRSSAATSRRLEYRPAHDPRRLPGELGPPFMDSLSMQALFRKFADTCVSVHWAIGTTDMWPSWAPICEVWRGGIPQAYQGACRGHRPAPEGYTTRASNPPGWRRICPSSSRSTNAGPMSLGWADRSRISWSSGTGDGPSWFRICWCNCVVLAGYVALAAGECPSDPA